MVCLDLHEDGLCHQIRATGCIALSGSHPVAELISAPDSWFDRVKPLLAGSAHHSAPATEISQPLPVRSSSWEWSGHMNFAISAAFVAVSKMVSSGSPSLSISS